MGIMVEVQPRSDLHLCDADHADGALGRRLAHDHLAGRDEAAREEIDDILAPAGPVTRKLLPIELVAHGEATAATPLQIALLEALVARHHLGPGVQARRQQEPVVVVWRHLGGAALDRSRGRGWERHDAGAVCGVLAGRQGGEGGRGCEEEVRAEAVVGVDCGGGGEGDFLLWGGRGHGEVGAGGGGDVHCGGGGGGGGVECVERGIRSRCLVLNRRRGEADL
jgi:hypothetical protein